jgi:hypothetical protein
MCHSEPTVTGGFEISPGDELGRDLAPDCCGSEMVRGTDRFGDLIYTCGCCKTVVEVDELGLVADIR